MLKSILLLSLVGMVAVSTGCGKSDEQKAQEKVEQGKTEIETLKLVDDQLYSYGVNLHTSDSAKSMNASKTDEIRKLLGEYIRLSSSIQAKAEDKNVILTGRFELGQSTARAQSLLADLEARGSRPASQPSAPSVNEAAELKLLIADAKRLNSELTQKSLKIAQRYLIAVNMMPYKTEEATGQKVRDILLVMSAATISAYEKDVNSLMDSVSQLDQTVAKMESNSKANRRAVSDVKLSVLETRNSVLAHQELLHAELERRAKKEKQAQEMTDLKPIDFAGPRPRPKAQ